MIMIMVIIITGNSNSNMKKNQKGKKEKKKKRHALRRRGWQNMWQGGSAMRCRSAGFHADSRILRSVGSSYRASIAPHDSAGDSAPSGDFGGSWAAMWVTCG